MKPLHDFVLVAVEKPAAYNQYANFTYIIVPTKYEHGPDDRAVIGTVLENGPDCRGVVEEGNRVIIGKWEGAYVTTERDRMIVREDDILAIIT